MLIVKLLLWWEYLLVSMCSDYRNRLCSLCGFTAAPWNCAPDRLSYQVFSTVA